MSSDAAARVRDLGRLRDRSLRLIAEGFGEELAGVRARHAAAVRETQEYVSREYDAIVAGDRARG